MRELAFHVKSKVPQVAKASMIKAGYATAEAVPKKVTPGKETADSSELKLPPNEQICTLRESSGLRLRGDESKSHTLSLFSQVLFAASLLLLLGQREDAFVVGLAGFDQVVEDTS